MVSSDTQTVFFRLLAMLAEKANCPLSLEQQESYVDCLARHGFEKSILAIAGEIDDYQTGQPMPSAFHLERRIIASKP